MPLVVGGVTFSDPVEGFTGIAGKYYLDDFSDHGSRFGVDTRKGFATDGHGIKRSGFDGRMFEGTVMYVGTQAGCVSDYEADVTAVMNVSGGVEVSVPGGGSFPACEVLEFRKLQQPKATDQNNTYIMRARISIDQKRLA